VKVVESLLLDVRSRLRARRARLGVASKPARLVVRLDDLDAPLGALMPATPLDADGWYTAIVRVLEWTGPVPVSVVARAENPHLADVIRFAHRLECRTTLRTCARGLAQRRAEELLDCGLAGVTVRVAGASDDVQQAVLGETVAEGVAAFRAMLAARHDRGAPCEVLAEVALTAVGAPSLPDVFSAARAAGLDGVVIAAPWRDVAPDDAVRRAIAWARTQHPPFHRTSRAVLDHLEGLTGSGEPGVRRRAGACAVGGLRLEIGPDGVLSHCPFTLGAVQGTDTAADDARALSGQRAAIRACGRQCAHPDLLDRAQP
jgi:hypothetical protein